MGFQTTGTASEYFAVDASKVTPIPEDMSYEEGAMIEPLAVAVHGVKQMGDVKRNEYHSNPWRRSNWKSCCTNSKRDGSS